MNMHSSEDGDHAHAALVGPPGRGRRSLLVRERLLAAAETLVANHEVAAITARDLARAAGVADGALYNHFDDKHDLVLAALLGRVGRLVELFDEDVATVRGAKPPLPLETGLERLVVAAYALHAAIVPMLAHVISEPELFRRFMVAIHRPPLGGRIFRDPFETYLTAEQAGGGVAGIDPAAAADLLMGAILMVSLEAVLAGRPAPAPEDRLHVLVRTLLSGLLPRP